eukprot:scaffold3136_cov43-Prasinocladus_malaysianus.AAC.1
MEELNKCLAAINCQTVDDALRQLKTAKQVFCYGVGREGLVLRSWVTRLQQLKLKVIGLAPQCIAMSSATPRLNLIKALLVIQAFFVGDPVCPALQTGDMLVVSAGPSYYAT